MIPIGAVIYLLIMHWIFDFLLQSDSMAINKSSSYKYLSFHVFVYSIGLSIFAFGAFSIPLAISWIIFNAMLHFVVDDNTSKFTSYLWKTNQRHWFFVTIGFDQLLHIMSLTGTYYLWSYV